MAKPKLKLSPDDYGKPRLRLSPEPRVSPAKKSITFRPRNPPPNNVLRELIKIVAVLGIAAVGFQYYVLAPAEHPSGNRAMQAMCNWELTAWESYQGKRPGFNFHGLSDDQKRRVIMFGLNDDFMIRTNFLWGTATNREMVIVCNRQYDNVPTPAPWNLFHHRPAHAVGYSDRTTGFISPAEFDSLFIYGFVPLWSLATNADSNFKIFKQ